MKPNSAEIIFVVDRSGSMARIAEDMRGGFKTFIAKQKETPGECKVSLARFDDAYEMVFEAKPLGEVPDLELEPRGHTALYDAVGRTIQAVGQRLAKTPEDQRPSHVLFVIITDGQENASSEYNREKVMQMITHQREKYSWEFTFLGADLNALDVAQGMGILRANAVMYSASPAGARAAMRGMAQVSSHYRVSAGGQSVLNVADAYTSALDNPDDDQKQDDQK